jgi:hypothetical protein
MQTRREFLTGATATLLLVPLVHGACGSKGDGACDGLQTTSTVAFGHTHTFCVPTADLTNPPASGATYTSSGPDPTHTVTLTQGQLQSIQSGQTVTVTSSVNGNHTHDFAIHK